MQAAKRLLGESLLTTEGEVHRRRRRLIQPILHHERVAAYAAEMVVLADHASQRSVAGEWIEMQEEMARLTLAIVGRTLFDTDVEAGDARDVSRALADVLAQFTGSSRRSSRSRNGCRCQHATVRSRPSLPVTQATLSEAMRLYPPAWAMGRRALADHRVDRYVLPRGSVMIFFPWLLHHDERWWPDAATFRLQRWSEEAISARPRRAYLPFGGGPRMCIGEGFARLEAELLVATIAQRWRFELGSAQEIALQPVVTLRPRCGMRMRAAARGTPRSPR